MHNYSQTKELDILLNMQLNRDFVEYPKLEKNSGAIREAITRLTEWIYTKSSDLHLHYAINDDSDRIAILRMKRKDFIKDFYESINNEGEEFYFYYQLIILAGKEAIKELEEAAIDEYKLQIRSLAESYLEDNFPYDELSQSYLIKNSECAKVAQKILLEKE